MLGDTDRQNIRARVKSRVHRDDKTESSESECMSCNAQDVIEDNDDECDQKQKYSLKQFRKIKKNQEIKRKMKAQQETRCYFVERDFCFRETVNIPKDVFGIMIAANMSQNANPKFLNYSLRICIQVFMLQSMMAVIYISDESYKNFNQF